MYRKKYQEFCRLLFWSCFVKCFRKFFDDLFGNYIDWQRKISPEVQLELVQQFLWYFFFLIDIIFNSVGNFFDIFLGFPSVNSCVYSFGFSFCKAFENFFGNFIEILPLILMYYIIFTFTLPYLQKRHFLYGFRRQFIWTFPSLVILVKFSQQFLREFLRLFLCKVLRQVLQKILRNFPLNFL